MSKKLTTNNLEFDFEKSEKLKNFDKDKGGEFKAQWKKAEALIEFEKEYWLIEVKEKKRTKHRKRDKCSIKRKAKETLLYLFIMNEYNVAKKVKYYVVLDPALDSAGMTTMNDDLNKALNINNKSWSENPFVEAKVYGFDSWNKKFSQFPVRRLS